MSAFFGKSVITVFFTGNRPRVCDETAERILERIAARESSDLDLSDSDEEAPEDVAVLDDLYKDLEPDVESSDEEPVHTVPAAPKRAVIWKTTDRYGLLFLVTKTRAYFNFKTIFRPRRFRNAFLSTLLPSCNALRPLWYVCK